MAIQFEDGSFLDAGDWNQIMRLISEKGRASAAKDEPPPRITEIRSNDGVTIKLGNMELKRKPKMPLANPGYVSGTHKGWTIRVWREEQRYGCNYFKGEDTRYFEYGMGDVSDENHMFKIAKAYIDEAINNE